MGCDKKIARAQGPRSKGQEKKSQEAKDLGPPARREADASVGTVVVVVGGSETGRKAARNNF